MTTLRTTISQTVLIILAGLMLAACVVRVNPIRVDAASVPVTALDQRAVDVAITQNAMNPGDVRIANLRAYALSNGGRAVCGLYDAPDAAGNYAGWMPFFLRLEGRDLVSASVADLGARLPSLMAQESCRQAQRGNLGIAEKTDIRIPL